MFRPLFCLLLGNLFILFVIMHFNNYVNSTPQNACACNLGKQPKEHYHLLLGIVCTVGSLSNSCATELPPVPLLSLKSEAAQRAAFVSNDGRIGFRTAKSRRITSLVPENRDRSTDIEMSCNEMGQNILQKEASYTSESSIDACRVQLTR
ncbi:hypothetical protein D918_03664 [Trichuris suis]|nr:hypothetical protein D918_03664 [Trichuris suis]